MALTREDRQALLADAVNHPCVNCGATSSAVATAGESHVFTCDRHNPWHALRALACLGYVLADGGVMTTTLHVESYTGGQDGCSGTSS